VLLAVEIAASGARPVTDAPTICVAGAGAIGGLLATMLARSGADVSVVARGETLRCIRSEGLTLDDGTTTRTVRVAADTRAPDAVQDLIVLAGKSFQLPGLMQTVAHAIGVNTVVLPVVNGVPWWMTLGTDSPFSNVRDLLDPDGALARLCPQTTIVGAVAYAFADVQAPGHVRSQRPPLIVLGDPGFAADGPARVARVVAWCNAAGIATRAQAPIGAEIWAKLALNLATNPLSVVTGADLGTLGTDRFLRPLVTDLLSETIAVGRTLGIAPLQTVEEHLSVITKGGSHMTSMFQDFEGSRALELAAIAQAVVASGAAVGIATPCASAVFRIAAYLSRHDG